MARTPKKPRLSMGKASKPDLKPLDPHLADLLNPALNREREAADGFGERPLETYAHGDATGVDPALAEKLGLSSSPRVRGEVGSRQRPSEGTSQEEVLPDTPPHPTLSPHAGRGDEDHASLDVNGVSATVDALTRLLTEGDPRFKDGKLWTPHRPPRPEKSEGGIRFKLVSDFEPAGDQPTAIAELVDGVRRQRARPGAARRHRLGQDLHHGQGDRGDAAPGADPGAEQDAGRPALRRVQERSSPTTRSSISSPTTTTTSPKPTSRAPTPTSRRKARSTSRSTACATRRRARCWSATTSSSSPRCPASTASARSRPTRR